VTWTEIVHIANTSLFQWRGGATRSHTNNSPNFPIRWEREAKSTNVIYRNHTKSETQNWMLQEETYLMEKKCVEWTDSTSELSHHFSAKEEQNRKKLSLLLEGSSPPKLPIPLPDPSKKKKKASYIHKSLIRNTCIIINCTQTYPCRDDHLSHIPHYPKILNWVKLKKEI